MATVSEVRLVCGQQLVAHHEHCWQKEQSLFDPVHYLGLLERKPGALDHARPLENWELPDSFGLLRRRLEANLFQLGTRECIRVPRLLETHSLYDPARPEWTGHPTKLSSALKNPSCVRCFSFLHSRSGIARLENHTLRTSRSFPINQGSH